VIFAKKNMAESEGTRGTAVSNPETRSWSGRTFLKLVTIPAMPIGVFVILFVVFLSFASPNFFTFSNIIAITRQTTILGVVSIGMALSIIAGGMDLSVGAVMALSISIAGTFSSYGWPYLSVFAIALLVGAACGLLNGLFINRLRISPIIVTLGTMNIYRGIAFVYTRGYWVTGLPSVYLRIGAGLVPLVLWLVVLGFSLWMTRQTRFGRHVYAVGGNENSAKLAGINVRSVKTAVYLICGVLAALGGMIFVGRTGVIQPSAGIGYEMQAIAAAVIGGASIVGGRGTMLGTFLGSILLGLLLNGLVLLKVSAYWQGAFTGVIIVVALLLDSFRFAYRERSR
jgi:ribose/xylose/arabinose/galactoside ABC-type transport system permease subunit